MNQLSWSRVAMLLTAVLVALVAVAFLFTGGDVSFRIVWNGSSSSSSSPSISTSSTSNDESSSSTSSSTPPPPPPPPQMSLTASDLEQIRARGSLVSEVERQLRLFRDGFPPTRLIRPTTVGDGLVRFSDAEADELLALYEEESPKRRCFKFVPASGAASRMFKSLFSYLDKLEANSNAASSAEPTKQPADVTQFFDNLDQFSFVEDLDAAMADVGGLAAARKERRYADILSYFLTDKGLRYGELPKALLRFHRYPSADGAGADERRTPFEEHLVEGAQYCRRADRTVHLHFTVSPAHRELFAAHCEAVRAIYESRFGVTFVCSFSEQNPATDTIAVTPSNEPFRLDDGSLLFRPAGHGALLENLDQLHGDIVFIKNIDNVVPERIADTTIRYKKVLGGLLLREQRRIGSYVRALASDRSSPLSDARLSEIATYVTKTLGSAPPESLIGAERSERVAYLLRALRRPLRVSGMVPNAGETGGGPFWVAGADGSESVQVVETAQIETSDPAQAAIMLRATHFHPVDHVISSDALNGSHYSLMAHRDLTAGFVTGKSLHGRDLKAQELPGLWNGGMADWNSIFVEVPLITFNPVKTVNDLLRAEHKQTTP